MSSWRWVNMCHVLLTLPLIVGSKVTWDYVIVGAGPSGLQMAYYLQQANRDYVILERANVSGSFFQKFPRHDKLISINKRHTGKTNKEFNLRHDWNSLLSDDERLQFRHFSKDFFPRREPMNRYLNTYSKRWSLNVKYGTEIVDIQRKSIDNETGHDKFSLKDQKGNAYSCRTLLVATGIWKPNIPSYPGMDLVKGYESIPTDPEYYDGKNVLILGHGNSAFETADSIYSAASVVHVVGRSRVRLSWETHYVGDVRGVNNNLLDTYQLKSMDGVVEGDLDAVRFERFGEKLRVRLINGSHNDNFALRHTYDEIIRCLGFTFDSSIFNSSLSVTMGEGVLSKFPLIDGAYQSPDAPGMYIMGSASHSLDFRRSAGGFIHGFRYTVRALHHILEWRNHRNPWPSSNHSLLDLLPTIVKRINEASGIYQMFGVLCDVILLNSDNATFKYIREFPVSQMPNFTSVTGHRLEKHIVILLEYGMNFSGPGKDIFRESRATGFANHAHNSNFLHPVLYYYSKPIIDSQFMERTPGWLLPRPDRIHHVVEDFLTDWSRDISHVLPLRRFLEFCVGQSLKNYFSEDCFQILMTHRTAPLRCESYINDNGFINSFSSLEINEVAYQ